MIHSTISAVSILFVKLHIVIYLLGKWFQMFYMLLLMNYSSNKIMGIARITWKLIQWLLWKRILCFSTFGLLSKIEIEKTLKHVFSLISTWPPHPIFVECFTVQAEDSGTPSLSSTATVYCFILDDNDNTPQFSQPDLHIIIPENLPPGVIHTVQASDIDNGLNGTIQYSIKGNRL